MKTIGFNIMEGSQFLVLIRKDKYGIFYFNGYMFQIPSWTSRKEDAVIFKNSLQACKFANSLKNCKVNEL